MVSLATAVTSLLYLPVTGFFGDCNSERVRGNSTSSHAATEIVKAKKKKLRLYGGRLNFCLNKKKTMLGIFDGLLCASDQKLKLGFFGLGQQDFLSNHFLRKSKNKNMVMYIMA